MAFMDQFRFGGQNDLLQMPNQGSFGMMQSPFGQQQPNQQYGFGMFQSPWQQNGGGYNPQPGNMGFNQTPVQNPSFQQPQNPTQNPNIGHNNPRFQVQNPGGGIGNQPRKNLPWTDQMQSEYDNLTRPGGPWEGKEEFLKNYLSLDKSGFRNGGLEQMPQVIAPDPNNPWTMAFNKQRSQSPAPVDWGKVNLNSGANQGDPNWVDPATGKMPYKPLPPGMVRQGG